MRSIAVSHRLIWTLTLALTPATVPLARAQGLAQSEIRAVETDKEAQIRELRDQEINQLRIALGRRLPQNRKAELYFRAAELYLEAYRQNFLIEGRVQQKRIEAGNRKAKLDRSYSKPYLKLGIKACEDLIRLKVPFSRMDTVYYFLGFNYAELENHKKAEEYFKALTSRYPNSMYAFDGYREIGETAFHAQDYRKAQGFLEQALRSRKASLGPQPRLLYYLSWCYYRLKQFDRAISTMKLAIREATQEDERFLSIREEALRDMAIFMTERGNVNEALSYFAQVQNDDTYYPKLLERLGHEYERNVQLPKAIQVYETLLRTKHNSESAYRVAMKLATLELKKGNVAAAVARIRKLPKDASRSAETEAEFQALKATVRKTATENHDIYRKKKGTKANLQTAEQLYGVYIDAFLLQSDPRKELGEIRMYLADVKRDLGRSAEASALYKQVIESKDEKYSKEAVSLWVGALADALKSQPPAKREAPSALEREFVEATRFLEEKQGVTAQTNDLLLRSAQLLAAYPKTQGESVEIAQTVIKRAPQSKAALTAAKLRIQLAVDRSGANQSDALEDALKEIRGNPELLEFDRKNGGEIAKILAQQDEKFKLESLRKMEKGGDFGKAAQEYERFALETKDKGKADKAFNNAIIFYGKAGDTEGVTRAAETWMKRDPKDKRPVQVLKDNATRMFIEGQFMQSAGAFQGLGVMLKDGASMETAAKIYEAEKKAAEAAQAYEAALKLQGKSGRAGEISLALAKLYVQSQNERQAASTFERCAQASKELESECYARLGDLYAGVKNREQARRSYQRALAARAASPYKAYAAFQLADEGRNEEAEPFSLPAERLKKQLDRRIEGVARLSKAFNPAIEAGGPWGIAALEKLAAYVRSIADDLDKVDYGSDAKLKEQILKTSATLRQQALGTLKTALDKCERDEILSPAIVEIQTALARKGVIRGLTAQGPYGGFRVSGAAPDAGDSALEQVRKKLSANGNDAQAWTDYGNLLWGQGSEGIARVAYDRALQADPKNLSALNNRAVVAMSGAAAETDWTRPLEAQALLKRAVAGDSFYTVAKINLGQLYNYFRLFKKAEALWEQVSVKVKDGQAFAGLAVAQQGLGQAAQAEASFAKASGAGMKSSSFVNRFNEGARAKSKEDCAKGADRADSSDLKGLEKTAVEALKRECQ